MLQRTEFGFKKLLNTEIGLFNIKDDYFEAIRRSLGKVFSRDHDFTEWLEFITAILEGESSILVKNITDWHRMMEDVRKSGEEVGLIPRQVDGYAFAVRTGQIIRGQYLEITSVSPVTASRDLADLVQKGLLTTEGKTRSWVYRPVSLEDFRKIATQAGQLPLLERREMIIIWQCQ
jgi:Fic family protein